MLFHRNLLCFISYFLLVIFFVKYTGCPPIEPGNGVVTEMRGKQVHSVLAKTPLEAWGKTLLSLGLIDDIIYDAALKALHKSREDGLVEARDKIDLVNKNRREARAKEKQRLSRGDGEKEDEKKGDDDVDATSKNDNDKLEEDLREPPSSEEVELLGKLNELENILTKAKQQSKAASANLASMRISSLSPFASNPFLCSDDSLAQEMTWMTAAVKKEKTKMGNTGNRRKIVTPATMMEKSDTFFVPEIERLIEGLTGSEFTPSYVFHANRSAAAAANQAWIHEAKVRHQKEQQKKLEKELKSAKEAEAKANIEREKDLKRKIKQEEFETRKRAKEEEEEQRKKERIEKRLTQLSLQMDDRLFKESCIIRERSIMNFVRGMNKEFNRRRRAAEVVVAHQVERSSSSPSSVNSLTSLVPFRETLPPLSRIYDEEVVRIWDFINSFHDAFSKNASTSSPPSINSLQDAIDCLKDVSRDQEKRTNAVDLVKNIAISLCKVISPSLTKSLASAPQVVVSPETNGSQDFSEGADLSCLPVTEWTWREIARMIIINDVLLDLGYSKMESANILKGYRSGGHPNSKEAKRLKKIEDSPLLMTYQQLENKNERNSPKYRRRMVTACLSVPCTPSVSPSDWLSPLHTIKSSPACSVSFMTDQVVCSLSALRKSPTGSLSPEKTTSYIDDLEKCLAILKRSKSSTSDITEAKQIVHGLLDVTREKQPSWATTQTDAIGSTQLTNQTNLSLEPTRQRMGFLKMYQLSREQYKSLDQSREDYMAAALRLKEDLERKTCDEANEEDDDDDDDEEEGVVSGSKTNNDSSTAEPKGESEATSKQDPPKQIAETDAFSNKEAYSNETVDKASSKPATANGEECVQVQENNPSIDKSTSSQSAENKDKQPACISTDGAEVPVGAAPPKPVSVNGEECVKVHDKNASVDKFTSSKSDENKDEKPPCNGTDGANPSPEDSGICGTKSDYDFCEDLPHAPDLIRRCLAVIRTLCASNSSDPFIYPVDPQLYPG